MTDPCVSGRDFIKYRWSSKRIGLISSVSLDIQQLNLANFFFFNQI
ncbi:hypothetical protein E2986_14134 [Frieseomelitta varia]|uniref:Uncharacterized protein n=1 Tax=Frieseomelitta varia TaxID=561572 RepID=A0A833RZE9_9HYME|nr:hypothetical protein E2986_14134 [Frieseomelitta varia]